MQTRLMIGLGAALALFAALVILFGFWGGSDATEKRTVEMAFGSRLVTVTGYYKDLTQELLADELVVTVDGREIRITDQDVTVGGVSELLDPGQNLEIEVDKKGDVRVGVADPAESDSGPETGQE